MPCARPGGRARKSILDESRVGPPRIGGAQIPQNASRQRPDRILRQAMLETPAQHRRVRERAAAQTALQQAGVDPMRRAESLTLDEWVRVAEAVALG